MSSSWDTPYRRAPMPETVVKIIGSKHYRFLVEKPKTSLMSSLSQVKENTTTKAQPELGPLVPQHGRQFGENPPALNSPADPKVQFSPDCRERNKGGKEEDKPGLVGAGSGSLGLRSSEDESLLAIVGREFKVHPPSYDLLDNLEKELKVLDPISSGLLLQSQLSRLLVKHEVPLQLPTVKLLFQRFTQTRYSELINYKKLLWFLRLAASNETQRSESLVDDIPVKMEEINDLDRSSSSETSDNLTGLLRSALKTFKGKLNIENLHLSFHKEDQPFSGHLPPSKVKAICEQHGLSLSPSLMGALCSHQDLNVQDEIKWQKLMEFLIKASLDEASPLPKAAGTKKEEVPSTVLAVRGSEKTESPTENLKHTEDREPPPANPAPETRASKRSEASRKIQPASQPYLSQLRNEEVQRETWMDRFRKLENALYLCDVNNTGVLEKERAKRLMHNYNLIYNLALSPLKIDQAARRFRQGENLLLEPALRYLKEL
ncbi:uncharacterized protein C1orf87 homolog isoform X3 [Phascolarctos cinereus]|uniref:Uncharacterized protein C1orf87 homolog isoform X4 n=1 Tax=Phascolarctos cinereus TaxID=38626 RepID=A0A6P5KSZ3_PHACI|nr:uncharacterized protein C1orf87 homolog isoform X4 [Phascolarctos cinereus]